MKDVKDVLTVAVGHIQELETAEQSRNLSRVTQPLSPDRLVGMESSSLSRFNLAFCPEQLSHVFGLASRKRRSSPRIVQHPYAQTAPAARARSGAGTPES